jgi:type 1 glutamine amidotransferase
MNQLKHILFVGSLLVLWHCHAATGLAKPRKIVLIAGKKSHKPGEHEYEKTVRLLKVLLDRAPNLKNIRTEIHFNGWPENPVTLEDADAIVTISDGQDGNLYSPVPFMTGERMQVMERQMKRGCGFMTLHFSTFAPDVLASQILEWGGGYFDWQGDDGQRNWYSAIKTIADDLQLGTPQHSLANGVTPFRFKDEFYYRIRFRENDARLKPILLAPALGGARLEHTVAWAVERRDGGRGFATTTGHYFSNWQNDNYRKLILNAIVWIARAKVPKEGVQSTYLDEAAVTAALQTPN